MKKVKGVVILLLLVIVLGGLAVGLHALMYGGSTNCAGTTFDVVPIAECTMGDVSDIFSSFK